MEGLESQKQSDGFAIATRQIYYIHTMLNPFNLCKLHLITTIFQNYFNKYFNKLYFINSVNVLTKLSEK